MLALFALAGATEMSGPSFKPPVSGMSQGQKAFAAALTMAVTVGLFAYGGLWLDRQLGTKPWLLLLLVLCGLVGGVLHLIWAVSPEVWPFGKPADDEERDDSQKPPG